MSSKISGRKCIICDRGYRNSKNVRLFRFPCEPKRLKIWIDLLKIKNLNIRTARICDMHFDPKYFGRRYLNKRAIPTRYLYKTVVKNNKNNSNDEEESDQKDFSVDINPDDYYLDSAEEELSCIEEFQEIVGFSEKAFLDAESCPNCREALERESQKRKWEEEHCPNCREINKRKSFYKKKYINLFQICQRQREEKNLLKKKVRLLNRKASKLAKNTKHLSSVLNGAKVSIHAKAMCSMLLCKTHVWRPEEQFVAESIFNFSPAMYKFLRNKFYFHLPSIKSLRRWAEIKGEELHDFDMLTNSDLVDINEDR